MHAKKFTRNRKKTTKSDLELKKKKNWMLSRHVLNGGPINVGSFQNWQAEK